jgi:hypothetical protein
VGLYALPTAAAGLLCSFKQRKPSLSGTNEPTQRGRLFKQRTGRPREQSASYARFIGPVRARCRSIKADSVIKMGNGIPTAGQQVSTYVPVPETTTVQSDGPVRICMDGLAGHHHARTACWASKIRAPEQCA